MNWRTNSFYFLFAAVLAGLTACAKALPPPTVSESAGAAGPSASAFETAAADHDTPLAPAEVTDAPVVPVPDDAPAADAKTAQIEADPLETFLEEGLENVDEVPEDTSDLEEEGPATAERPGVELPDNGFFSKNDTELSRKLGGLTVFRGYPTDQKTPRNFVPIVYNAAVEKWIGYFTSSKGSPYMERWLAREKRYGPLLRSILKEHGLPEEIVYLAMIESGFNVRAYSTARAVGLWQFIAGTGKRYDMQINWWVDERRDPVRATHAAAEYLDDLYTEFESWHLAFAGYNAGEGKVRKVKRRSGADSFWEMRTIRSKRQGLFPETREYVPKYMAAAIIAQAPEKFGFKHLPVAEPLEFDNVTVPGGTSLYLVATAAECDYDDVKKLNPHLLRWFVPPNEKSYEIHVPKGKGPSFIAKFDELSQTEGLDDFKHYKWEKGDTLLAVSYRYDTDPDAVAMMNNGRKEFRPGEEMVLPVPRAVEPLELPKNWKLAHRLLKRHDAVEPHYALESGHVVTGRDSLKSIAREYGVTTNALKLWNRLDKRNRIRQGDVLTVYKASGDARAVALASTSEGAEFISYPDDDNEPVNPLKGLTGEEIRYRGHGTGGSPVEYIPSGSGTYRVQSGETASEIARGSGISLSALKELNPNTNLSRIHVGQVLRVAVASAPASGKDSGKASGKKSGAIEKKSAARETASDETPRTHMVRRGENATVIARRYDLTMDDLRGLNPGKKLDRLRVGDRILLRDAAPAKATAKSSEKPARAAVKPAAKVAAKTADPDSVSDRRHKVRKGENATTIARKYGVSVSELRKWNPDVNLNRVKAGQTLVIRESDRKS